MNIIVTDLKCIPQSKLYTIGKSKTQEIGKLTKQRKGNTRSIK